MQKTFIRPMDVPGSALSAWLPLQTLAQVEITSEAPGFPIEAALPGDEPRPPGAGWRANEPGRQIVRLRFNWPQAVRRVHLDFREHDRQRTQEFVLRWSCYGNVFAESRRQQFTFAPPGTTREIEEFEVNLGTVEAIELDIIPDISGGPAVASLQELRIA